MANTKKETLVEGMQEQTVEQQEQVAENEKRDKVKEYKFVSSNKYLTVSSLGVQFVKGKATVTDLEVARALATIDGVTLVED